jgi:hypothetical protein
MWMLCSGAKKEMHNNPGYYDYISKHFPPEIILPSYSQIDKVKYYINLIISFIRI